MTRYRYCEHCCKRVPSEGNHTCRPPSPERIVPAPPESTPAPARFIENLKPAETEHATEGGASAERYANSETQGIELEKDRLIWFFPLKNAYLAGLREGRRLADRSGLRGLTLELAEEVLTKKEAQLAAAQSEVSLAKQDLESYRREMKIHKEAAQAEIEELRNVEASLAHANHQLEVDRDRLRELVKAAEEALVRLLEIEPDPGELGGHYDDCAIADRDDGEGGEPECDCGVSDRWTKAAEALARLRSGKGGGKNG